MNAATRDELVELAWNCYLSATIVVKMDVATERERARMMMIDSRYDRMLWDGFTLTRGEVALLVDAMREVAVLGDHYSRTEIQIMAGEALS